MAAASATRVQHHARQNTDREHREEEHGGGLIHAPVEEDGEIKVDLVRVIHAHVEHDEQQQQEDKSPKKHFGIHARRAAASVRRGGLLAKQNRR